MVDTQEMLQFIAENAQMGADSTAELMTICQNPEFMDLLHSQESHYKGILNEATTELQRMGYQVRQINPIAKMGTSLMMNMQTLTNKEPSHLADMMMQGSNMGIIDIQKKINDYNGSPQILSLATRLLDFEESSLENFKKYL